LVLTSLLIQVEAFWVVKLYIFVVGYQHFRRWRQGVSLKCWYHTTLHGVNNPEDLDLKYHCCEGLTTHIKNFVYMLNFPNGDLTSLIMNYQVHF